MDGIVIRIGVGALYMTGVIALFGLVGSAIISEQGSLTGFELGVLQVLTGAATTILAGGLLWIAYLIGEAVMGRHER